MKRLLFSGSVLLILGIHGLLYAQVGINTDGSAPDPNAMLDVKSTTKGFLPPRMTTGQMNGIITPPEALIVYNTSVKALYWFDGSMWKKFNDFSFTETDPVFALHAASGITATDLSHWNTAYANRILGVSATAPLTLNLAGNQITGSMTAASAATAGYLTPSDWTSFHNKQNALTFGNVTSPDMTVTGGSGAAVGGGVNLAINKGHLTSTDITVTGGTNAVLGSGAAMTINKGNLTETGSSVLTIAGGSNAVLGAGSSIEVKQAGTTQSGYLSSAHWNAFNNKVSSQWVTSGSNIYYNSGNVGIGTTNPARKLEVYGIACIRGGGYLAVDAISAGDKYGYITSAGNTTGAGLKFETARPQDAVGVVRMTISNEGNVGIGWNDPHAPIQLSNLLGNRKIVLFEDVNNDHQYYGFGVNGNTLRYQVNTTSDRHVFYAGNGSSSSVELMRIQGNGTVGIGTSAPSSAAVLDLGSTSKGFLPPRMTSGQMNAISSPPEGIMIYNTTVKSMCWYNGTSWIKGNETDGQSCGTVSYGGKTYNTVIIGMQCWFKENLNIGLAILGSSNQTNNGIIEKYCYNDLENNCDIYGGLYQWDEAMQYVITQGAQGICPAGWHLPTDAEWTNLTDYLGGEAVAGDKMKEAGAVHWAFPNNATNSSGFTALPGGTRFTSGNFYDLRYDAYFWSSSQYASSNAWYRVLGYNSANVYRNDNDKPYGYSVRCLKD